MGLKHAHETRFRLENGIIIKERKWSRYLPYVRNLAKELLASGLSLRAVEKVTGVGRGVLSRVRRGEFWKNDEYEVIETLGPKHRCLQCGAMVFGKCVACKITQSGQE